MNLETYETTHQPTYAEFASYIRTTIKEAIASKDSVPRPQATQSRAKTAASLRQKLADRNLLESTEIEALIKDLAGVRLIFYTDSDVNTFLQARIIPALFDVDWSETRTHHPTNENDLQQYQAIHYTVTLANEDAGNAQHQKYKGMRCEIQIQTILNHAWAETYHDMIYKARGSDGFGSRMREALNRRMRKLMDDYLRPAGYELQKVQHDYKRLLEGKALFDRDALDLLAQSRDNNTRYDTLERLNRYVIPHYDDIAAAYPEIRRAVLIAVASAHTTLTTPIETIGGPLPGKNTEQVLDIGVSVLDNLRYVDVAATLQAWIELYNGTANEESRDKIVKAAARLAHYDLDVWKKVGPHIQSTLADAIRNYSIPQPILLALARETLSTALDTTKYYYDRAAIQSAALPANAEVRRIRTAFLDALSEIFEIATSEQTRREVLSAMREATRLPSQAAYSNDVIRMVLGDTGRLVELCARHVNEFSYEFLQHIEHSILFDYRRASDFMEDHENRFECQDAAKKLCSSIIELRDSMNRDDKFVVYKTLVGFESVFPDQWDNEELAYADHEDHRSAQTTKFVEQITEETADTWFALIQRCAKTKSEDLATFPIFGEFLRKISAAKPSIAISLFNRPDSNLENFVPALLNGLADSQNEDAYSKQLRQYLDNNKHLSAIIRHAKTQGISAMEIAIEVFDRAVAIDDDYAVVGCISFAVQYGANQGVLVRRIFDPAIAYLTQRREGRWIHHCWFLKEARPFFESLSSRQAEAVLENLRSVERIDHHVEGILKALVRINAAAVWSFFEARIATSATEGAQYVALPHKFHDAQAALAETVDAGLAMLRRWHASADDDLRYASGRLLHAVFPVFTDQLAARLVELLRADAAANSKFVCEVLGNYEGETATHPVFKQLIAELPEGHELSSMAELFLDNTGVVSGELGFVEAYRRKKERIQTWLTDPSERIRDFAEARIKHYDQRIASEQRSAEASIELRRRHYESDEE